MALSLKSLKGRLPHFISTNALNRRIDDAIADAVDEERNWGGIVAGGNRQSSSVNNPYAQIMFDDSPLYRTDGPFNFGFDSIHMRPEVQEGTLTKVRNGLARLLEAATAGWATYGSSGLSMARDIAEEHLFLAQDAVVLKSKTDPHAVGIIKNIVFYTIGEGVKVDTPSSEIRKILMDFRLENNMSRRERSMVKELFQEGEYFTVYFTDPATGRVKIRKFRPKTVTEIETNPEDMETRLAYKREPDLIKAGDERWYPDINYFNQLEDDLDHVQSKHHGTFEQSGNIFVQFTRYGDDDELRGWPPMYSALRWLKYLEDFVMDRARLHHERAKVIWFMTRKGSGRKTRGERTNPTPLLAPKGGTMWVEDETVSYRSHSLDLSSGDAEKDALLLLYAISSCVCVPLHVWNQRADQAVYSSLRKADTPFAQSINNSQTFLDLEWEQRDRFILERMSKAGNLPDEVKVIRHDEDRLIKVLGKINEMYVDGKSDEEIIAEASQFMAPGIREENVPWEDVPITRTFPDVVQEAPLDLAKVLLIHQKLGIVSDATLSARAGYDWTAELVRRLQDIKRKEELQKMIGVDPEPKPGPGRLPGDGAGGTNVSRDDLSAGGDSTASSAGKT